MSENKQAMEEKDPFVDFLNDQRAHVRLIASVGATFVGVGLFAGVALSLSLSPLSLYTRSPKPTHEPHTNTHQKHRSMRRSGPRASGAMGIALKSFAGGTALCAAGASVVTIGVAKGLGVSNMDEFAERMRQRVPLLSARLRSFSLALSLALFLSFSCSLTLSLSPLPPLSLARIHTIQHNTEHHRRIAH